MQRESTHFYINTTHYYVIITKRPKITRYYLFHSPEFADGASQGTDTRDFILLH